MPKKLILVVIDGLTPEVFEDAVETESAPALAFLARNGSYRRGISTFPSLTPVCLSSIATGAHPDVHRIPHLVWWHRGEGRLVEYGSSFAAIRAAGTRRSIVDAIFNMNEQHLGRDAVTVYEALEHAGLTTAAVNITCYRGRTPHLPVVPGLTRPAYGPKGFFFYSLFESEVTGAPVGVFGRSTGSIDAYAGYVGRWLVTRDGFDLLVFYLPDYDFASHVLGPGANQEALARSDAAVGALIEAAGGADEFLERYAVIVCSDHGQTGVERAVSLQASLGRAEGVLVTASNRAGHGLPPAGLPRGRGRAGAAPGRLCGGRGGALPRGRRGGRAEAGRGASFRACRRRLADERRPLAARPARRARASLGRSRQPERRRAARLAAARSRADRPRRPQPPRRRQPRLARGRRLEVPILTVGLDAEPRRIVDLAPLALEHFGVELPAYADAA